MLRATCTRRLLPAAVVVVVLAAMPVAAGARPAPHGRRAAVTAPGASLTTFDFPDPSVLPANGAYWAYATRTAWEPRGHVFGVLRSTDLVHWRKVGDALSSPPRWTGGHWWAPSVLEVGGQFLLYYSAQERGHGDHCIGLAVSGRPQGPFLDRGPLACGDPDTAGYIDPAPFQDADGSIYLYLSVDGPSHELAVIPLTPDGLTAAGPLVTLLGVNQAWQRGLADETVEGPAPVLHDGRYYLLYSTGSYRSDYRMGYAVAASALGPFVDAPTNPMLVGGPLTAPGGGSVFDGPGGPWLAFHAWRGPANYARGGARTLRAAPLVWAGEQLGVAAPGGAG